MRALVVLIAVGALAGCGSKEAKQTQGASFGKVLPGSASDAMLPYDTASSSPPLAPETYEAPKDEAGPNEAGPNETGPDEAGPNVRPKASDAAAADTAPEAEPT